VLICKLCGEALEEDEVWKHLVLKHKEEIMKFINPVWVKCDRCKRYFKAIPEPVYDDENGLRWVVPAYCKKCSPYNVYGFIVKYIDEKKITVRR
jgi:hypothetical protein